MFNLKSVSANNYWKILVVGHCTLIVSKISIRFQSKIRPIKWKTIGPNRCDTKIGWARLVTYLFKTHEIWRPIFIQNPIKTFGLINYFLKWHIILKVRNLEIWEHLSVSNYCGNFFFKIDIGPWLSIRHTSTFFSWLFPLFNRVFNEDSSYHFIS